MTEVRWHGRGGQGAVTSAELVALAAIEKGKYGQSFPSFGPERRGAPVQAFLRVDDEPIRVRAEISEPDVVVVLNPDLLRVVNVTSGLKKGGTLIVNTKRPLAEIKAAYGNGFRVATVDATKIAKETIGLAITNTTMIGALLKVAGLVTLDDMSGPLQHRFGKVADKNDASMRRAYAEIAMEDR
ncbi:MAG: 2-oxoacid:acceptor oxidoreductase family protein [Dehalococcoidia bacterium]|nr:2-oxoacid:acceptor oxidoreductase family protein [Dehalococcoidia bacterium]